MRILVVDSNVGLDITRQLALSGDHEVYYHNSARNYGEGVLGSLGVERVDDYWHFVEDADFIVFTGCVSGDDIDFLRSRGYKVFGASKEGQELEHDKKFANKIFKQCDMDITTEEITDGIEASITSYFNGEKSVAPYFINLAHERLMDGELGPSTDGMGTLILATYDEDLLFIKYLKNIEPYLKGINYYGTINIDCVANEEGFWTRDFTASFGYPLSTTQLILYEEPLADILYKTATGELEDIAVKDDIWAIGVCLNTAGYPFDEVVSKSESLRIFGIKDAEEDGCKLGYGALTMKDEKYFTIPGHGRALVINGTGLTIEGAREDAYKAMDYISFDDVSYRLDIGMKIDRVLDKLVAYGVLPKVMSI